MSNERGVLGDVILKKCTGCSAELPLGNYYDDIRGKHGKRSTCKTCSKKHSMSWTGLKAYQKRYNDIESNRRRYRSNILKRKFGISIERYDALLDAQDGVCALCLKPEHVLDKSGTLRSLAVDHNHVTSRIRGLLCFTCNYLLGGLARCGRGLIKYIDLSGTVPTPEDAMCVDGLHDHGRGCLGRGIDTKKSRRCSELVRRFGITLAVYDDLKHQQEERCALCRKPEVTRDHRSGKVRGLAVDHEHQTGRIRGLLCAVCNTTIGYFEGDASRIERMKQYLLPEGMP